MADQADLRDLLARVEAATWPDRLIDSELYATLGGAPHIMAAGKRIVPFIHKGDPLQFPTYTASIDAALALVERALPEWHIAMGTVGENDGPWACLTEPTEPYRDFLASGPDIPLAILSALLRALIHQGHTT